MNLVNLY